MSIGRCKLPFLPEGANGVETFKDLPVSITTGIDIRSQIWEHIVLRVYGEAALAKFAKRYPAARRPLQRFLEVAREADWPHFPAVKQSFAAADYAPSSGTLIFDIGGNKYRLLARVDFGEQVLYVERVLTHEDYNREDL